jgi:hypothetical protein
LVILLVYVVWRMISVVLRTIEGGRRDSAGLKSQRPGQQQPPAEKFHDIRDAEFEDLPPKEKKK